MFWFGLSFFSLGWGEAGVCGKDRELLSVSSFQEGLGLFSLMYIYLIFSRTGQEMTKLTSSQIYY